MESYCKPGDNAIVRPMKRPIRFVLLPNSLLCVATLLLTTPLAAQINPGVTDKTKILYSNLKQIQSGSHFLFGQEFFNTYQYSSGGAQGDPTISDSKTVTGANPAVLGSDF